MELPQFVKEHQPIIGPILGATIAGLFAITAALIRRPPRDPNARAGRPFARLLLPPLVSLLLGAGCLAAENFLFNLDPDKSLLNLDNPGGLLCLGGCVLVSAGVIWGLIDLFRLLTWRRPKEPEPAPSSTLLRDRLREQPAGSRFGDFRKGKR